jgi:positive regulator of sigma E activity
MKGHRQIQVVQGNGFPLRSVKVMPNDPCKCGSGKKAKKCCGAKTTFYYSKLNMEQEVELEKKKALEEEQKITVPMG